MRLCIDRHVQTGHSIKIHPRIPYYFHPAPAPTTHRHAHTRTHVLTLHTTKCPLNMQSLPSTHFDPAPNLQKLLPTNWQSLPSRIGSMNLPMVLDHPLNDWCTTFRNSLSSSSWRTACPYNLMQHAKNDFTNAVINASVETSRSHLQQPWKASRERGVDKCEWAQLVLSVFDSV